MINSDGIKMICNYQEQSSPINPNTSISYIDFVDMEDEIYLNDLKTRNRELAIGAVLDNKIEEYENRESYPIKYNSDSSGIISPKAHSIGIGKGTMFTSHDSLWNSIINHIESSTQHVHPIILKNNIQILSYSSNTNISDFENTQALGRRIQGRIFAISNMMASLLNRRGPATFILVGSGIPQYLNLPYNISSNNIIGNIGNINVIVSNRIKSNKIIVGRSESTIDGGGLIVMSDLTTNYMFETPRTFYKNFTWFEVIV